METYPTADCYPDRFLNGQHVFGPYLDTASQKDSLSQYHFEHVSPLLQTKFNLFRGVSYHTDYYIQELYTRYSISVSINLLAEFMTKLFTMQ